MLGQALDKACSNIIAPDHYHHKIHLICPKEQDFDGETVQRIDFQVLNQHGKKLSALILAKKGYDAADTILYLHGNGGSKLQALNFLSLVSRKNINVVCFDFIGCGNSDSGFLTYGVEESKDAKIVLQQAKKIITIKRLNVWGRSMGALTAILFCQKHWPEVSSLILDSPFQKLDTPVLNVIQQQTKIPQTIANLILYLIKSSISSKVSVPIFSIDYLAHFKSFSRNLPVLLIYSRKDETVPALESLKFYNASRGKRDLLQIEETHEQDRGKQVFEKGILWFKKEKSNSKKGYKLRLSHWSEGVEVETVPSLFTC